MNDYKDIYDDFIYELATDTKKRKAILANPNDYINQYYNNKVGDFVDTDIAVHSNTKDIFYFVMPYIADGVDISSISAAVVKFGVEISSAGTVACLGSSGSVGCIGSTLSTVSTASSASTVGVRD